MKTTDEINIDRTVKKAAIGWFVPAALCVVCIALLTLGRVQVQGMLAGYVTKEQAAQDKKEYNDRLDVYARQISDMQATLMAMDKKLDHLQYALDFAQDRPVRLNSPKTKDTGP
jgi:late competence protein required for DNA uptake (superfamily II DNA/RNA helicase)